MTRRVLVVTAHPDDAEIVAGGTIARLVDEGNDVIVAVLTTSEYTPEAARLRRDAAIAAAEILGHRLLWVDDGIHNQVEDLREYELVSRVDALVSEIRPTDVLSHWFFDSHGDHVRTARAVASSLRRSSANIYALPPSEYRAAYAHPFPANVFIDIGDHVDRKRAALEQFAYQNGGFQAIAAESVLALNRALGVSAGYSYAEGFATIRQRGFAAPAATGEISPADSSELARASR